MSKRKFLLLSVVLLLMVLAIGIFFRPLSISEQLFSGKQLYLLHTTFAVENGVPKLDTNQSTLEQGSDEYYSVKEILSQYRYRRCLSTLFSSQELTSEVQTLFISGENGSFWISISDTSYLMINNRIYRLTGSTASDNQSLLEQLLEVCK